MIVRTDGFCLEHHCYLRTLSVFGPTLRRAVILCRPILVETC